MIAASRRRRVDRGELGASSVESALVLPAVILVFFAIIQGAATLHAGNVAQSAAQATFEAARLYASSPEEAAEVGRTTADSAGTALTDVDVSVEITDVTVVVTVSGSAVSIVPGVPIRVERTVTGQLERWVE